MLVRMEMASKKYCGMSVAVVYRAAAVACTRVLAAAAPRSAAPPPATSGAAHIRPESKKVSETFQFSIFLFIQIFLSRKK